MRFVRSRGKGVDGGVLVYSQEISCALESPAVRGGRAVSSVRMVTLRRRASGRARWWGRVGACRGKCCPLLLGDPGFLVLEVFPQPVADQAGLPGGLCVVAGPGAGAALGRVVDVVLQGGSVTVAVVVQKKYWCQGF